MAKNKAFTIMVGLAMAALACQMSALQPAATATSANQASAPVLGTESQAGIPTATAAEPGGQQEGSVPVPAYFSPTPVPTFEAIHVPSQGLFFPPFNAVAQNGQWTVAVLGWGIVQGIGNVQPDAGMKFLEVDVAVLNRGSTWDGVFADSSSTQVEDASSGTAYESERSI